MANETVAKGKRRTWTDYLYLMPAVVLITVFFISSIAYTGWLSFYESDGFSAPVFVGFKNYAYLFRDANFMISLGNTIIWVVCSLVISFAIPLFLAILIVKSRHVSLFKNIFYFPNVQYVHEDRISSAEAHVDSSASDVAGKQLQGL